MKKTHSKDEALVSASETLSETKSDSASKASENEPIKDNILEDEPVSKQSVPDMDSAHKFTPNRKYFTILIYSLLFVFFTLALYKLMGNFGTTGHFLKSLLSLLSPFITALLIALVLHPFVIRIYKGFLLGVCHIKSKKIAKYLSILIAYIVAFGFFIVILLFVIPQVYNSLIELSNKIPAWYKSTMMALENFQEGHQNIKQIAYYDEINAKIRSLLPTLIDHTTVMASNLLPYVVNTSVAIIKGLFNFLIAIISSVYMLSDRENLFYNGKKVLYAVFPKRTAQIIIKIVKNSVKLFTGFIVGKAIDSLIIGMITFIIMMILGLPYAVLISVIVGVTNMIPYFGPYFGGAIGALIIIIVEPISALIFIILIIVVQQFDGLYLGPKILGDSTGLTPLWVIFSITVGGSLFGVIGMFLGVPVVAVLSYIINLFLNYTLEKKNIVITKNDD